MLCYSFFFRSGVGLLADWGWVYFAGLLVLFWSLLGLGVVQLTEYGSG